MNHTTELQEREIIIKLRDSDCEKLICRCGSAGLTIGELVGYFINDLIGGAERGGSDEMMLAERWYERRGFEELPGQTLLQHLLWNGYDPEDYLELLDNIETAEEEKKYLEEHPEEADEEEASYLDDDIADWQEELKSMREGWSTNTKPDMASELANLKSWIAERDRLMMN